MVMALADALQTLLRLPGATYACVVERDSGRVLAELGGGEAGAGDSEGVVPYSVPRWGTAVAAMFDSTSGDELDDVMITGRRSYHLVRPLDAGGAVLAYLRLDRSRSNLAAARRELAAVRLSGGPAVADRPSAARTRDEAPSGTRLLVGSTSPARSTSIPASLAPPTTPAGGLRSPAAAGPASRSAARGSAGAATSASGAASGSARVTGRGRVGSSTTRPTAPARARTRAEVASPAQSAVPAPSRPSGDAARQIPLPRRAPGRTEAGPARRSEARSRGAGAAVAEPAPEGFAVPSVLGQSWAQDPGTLRRLLAGLRRMG